MVTVQAQVLNKDRLIQCSNRKADLHLQPLENIQSMLTPRGRLTVGPHFPIQWPLIQCADVDAPNMAKFRF